MTSIPNDQRRRIVILGGGFGGAYCAQALAGKLDDAEIEVVLIDRRNYFVFYPFLVEAGTGSLAARHAVISLRSFSNRARFLMAEVVDVDPGRKTVSYRMGGEEAVATISYDHLVLSLGSVTRLPDVPGLAEHGFSIKSLADAIALRDRAVHMLELANATTDSDRLRSLLSFVVVGGNFTGVEVAGEFHNFLRQAARGYPNLEPDACRVTLVEIAGRILPGLDGSLSDYALENLRRRNVGVRLSSSVTEIHEDKVRLEDGGELPARTLIWCAGIAQNPLITRLSLPRDEQGWIECEPDLRVQGMRDVWAVGDGAVNPDPDGRPYPATAQVAVRQGIHLAGNLAAELSGQSAKPFVYKSKGTIVGLGCRTGVARIGPLKLSGFAAWFAYRTLYLFKLPGWARRARVALDWTMDLLFPRDYVELGILRSRLDRGGKRQGLDGETGKGDAA